MVFSRLFPSEKSGGAESPVQHDTEASDSEPSIIHDGDLAYTRVKGGNGSKPSYQEAVGAPVESDSPLGYHVNWIAIIFLNVNMMVGTGVFSTRTSSRCLRHQAHWGTLAVESQSSGCFTPRERRYASSNITILQLRVSSTEPAPLVWL